MSDDSTSSPRVLAIDDEVAIHGVLERLFPREGIEVNTCTSGEEAKELLEEEACDLVLANYQMPEMSGIELIEHVQANHPQVGVILLSAQDGAQQAVQAMRKGAVDYIPKPFSTDELVDRVKSALRTQAGDGRAGSAPEVSPSAPKDSQRGEGGHEERSGEAAQGRAIGGEGDGDAPRFVGQHSSIERIKAQLPRVAKSEAPVFLHGESGTGKEVLARLFHEESGRSGGPYVPINCAALPSDLVESHLFGHVEGAFTGAVSDMTGAFEKADGGTLLLDEVTEIAPSVQAKLLRVLQTQTFSKVGSSEMKEVDVRVVATSNRDLEEAVSEGSFREDLYHRLAVFPVHIPPLRARLSDIPLLAEHFASEYAERYGLPEKSISPGLLKYFQTYDWPGNVRELKNMIHRGVVMAGEREYLDREDVASDFFSSETPDAGGVDESVIESAASNGDVPTIAEVERKLILRTLSSEDVSQKEAADKLGVSARTIRNKLKEYRSEGYSV